MGFLGFWRGLVNSSLFVAGIVYPAYESVTSLESPKTGDDLQWLNYWLLYALLQIFEFAARPLLRYVPLAAELKLLYLLWLELPQTQGAKYAYINVIRPTLQRALKMMQSVPALQRFVDSMPIAKGLLVRTTSRSDYDDIFLRVRDVRFEVGNLIDKQLDAYTLAANKDQQNDARRRLEKTLYTLLKTTTVKGNDEVVPDANGKLPLVS